MSSSFYANIGRFIEGKMQNVEVILTGERLNRSDTPARFKLCPESAQAVGCEEYEIYHPEEVEDCPVNETPEPAPETAQKPAPEKGFPNAQQLELSFREAKPKKAKVKAKAKPKKAKPVPNLSAEEIAFLQMTKRLQMQTYNGYRSNTGEWISTYNQ